MSPWEEVYKDGYKTVKRMSVPKGWIYLTEYWSQNNVSLATSCFVPDPGQGVLTEESV
jgi:hypothetical protein